MASLPITRYAPEEYLAFERVAAFRSEYCLGEIVAMAGGSPEHNTLIFNITTAIGAQIKGRDCRGFVSDMRLQVDRGVAYVYPDVMALCGKPIFSDADRDSLVNPSVVVEVLSRSTEAYDRGLKFANYRLVESLQEYVLVSQAVMRVELYVREADGHWILRDLTNPDDVLELSSIGCQVTVSDIYDQITVASALSFSEVRSEPPAH